MQERRKLPRWQISRQGTIKLEGAVSEATCQVKDINFKGMQIILNIKLALDSYVRFHLAFSKECSLDVEAWVAWHKQIEGRNIYGLYFTKLKDTDKERIYKFVYNNIPKEISKSWWIDPLKKEGGEEMNDRRIFQRFDVRIPAKILDLNSGAEMVAETSDISAKGIGLMLKRRVAINTPLEAWLQIPDKGEPLYTRGITAWSKQEAEGDYRIGVELERADLMGLSRILRV